MNIKAIEAKKHLGQNFLTDRNIAAKIIDLLEIESGSTVLEIGPGTGALTSLMLERGYIVHAIEIDERAVGHLKKTYPTDKLIIHHTSIERFDIREFAQTSGQKLNIIGNIPYNITSEILFMIFDNADIFRRAIIMMQREVAMRLNALPRSKDYGILTLACNYSSKAKRCFDVSPHSFSPQPKVTSSVVRFDCSEIPEKISRELFKKTMVYVRAGFNQRRKKLSNSLKSTDVFTVAGENEWIKEISEKRAEELTTHDFIKIVEIVQLHKENN